jgi:hypothetical protein
MEFKLTFNKTKFINPIYYIAAFSLLLLYIIFIRAFKISSFALLSLFSSLYSSLNYISLEILISPLIILNYSFFYLKENIIIGALSFIDCFIT